MIIHQKLYLYIQKKYLYLIQDLKRQFIWKICLEEFKTFFNHHRLDNTSSESKQNDFIEPSCSGNSEMNSKEEILLRLFNRNLKSLATIFPINFFVIKF